VNVLVILQGPTTTANPPTPDCTRPATSPNTTASTCASSASAAPSPASNARRGYHLDRMLTSARTYDGELHRTVGCRCKRRGAFGPAVRHARICSIFRQPGGGRADVRATVPMLVPSQRVGLRCGCSATALWPPRRSRGPSPHRPSPPIRAGVGPHRVLRALPGTQRTGRRKPGESPGVVRRAGAGVGARSRLHGIEAPDQMCVELSGEAVGVACFVVPTAVSVNARPLSLVSTMPSATEAPVWAALAPASAIARVRRVKCSERRLRSGCGRQFGLGFDATYCPVGTSDRDAAPAPNARERDLR
jgi:hypothetical protein